MVLSGTIEHCAPIKEAYVPIAILFSKIMIGIQRHLGVCVEQRVKFSCLREWRRTKL